MDCESNKLMSDDFQDELNLIIIRLAKSVLVHQPLDINKHFDEILAADLDRRTLVEMQFEPYYQRMADLKENNQLYTVRPDKEIVVQLELGDSMTGKHVISEFKDNTTSTLKNPEGISNNTKNGERGTMRSKPPPVPPRFILSEDSKAAYPQVDKPSTDVPTPTHKFDLSTEKVISESIHMPPAEDVYCTALEGMVGYVLAFDTSDADDTNDNSFGLSSRRELYEQDPNRCALCDNGHYVSQSSSGENSSEDEQERIELNSSEPPINEEALVARGWIDSPNYFNVPGRKPNMLFDLSRKKDSNPCDIKQQQRDDKASSLREKGVCSQVTRREDDTIFIPDNYNSDAVFPPATPIRVDHDYQLPLKIQSENGDSPPYSLQTIQQSCYDPMDRDYIDTASSLGVKNDDEQWPDLPTDLECTQTNDWFHDEEEMLLPEDSLEPENIRPVRANILRLSAIEEDNLESVEYDHCKEPPEMNEEYYNSTPSCLETSERCENEVSDEVAKKNLNRRVRQSVFYAALCYMNLDGPSTTEDLMQDMLQSEVLTDEEDDSGSSETSGMYDTGRTHHDHIERKEEKTLSANLKSKDQLALNEADIHNYNKLPLDSEIPNDSSVSLLAQKTYLESIRVPLGPFIHRATINEQVASNQKVKEIEAWLHRDTSEQDCAEKIKDDESWLSLLSSHASSQADNESETLDKSYERIESNSKQNVVENEMQPISDASRDEQPERSCQLASDNDRSLKRNPREDADVDDSYSEHCSLAPADNKVNSTIKIENNPSNHARRSGFGSPASESVDTDIESEDSFSSASNFIILADNFKIIIEKTEEKILAEKYQDNSLRSIKMISDTECDSSAACKLLESGRFGENIENIVKSEVLCGLPATDKDDKTNIGKVHKGDAGPSAAPDDTLDSYRYDKMNFITSLSANASRNHLSSVPSSFLNKTNQVKLDSVGSCSPSLCTAKYVKSNAVDSSNAESTESVIIENHSSSSVISDSILSDSAVTSPIYIALQEASGESFQKASVASGNLNKPICLITQCKPVEQILEKSSSVRDCRLSLSSLRLESISMPTSFGAVRLSDNNLSGVADVTVSNTSYFAATKLEDTSAVRQSSQGHTVVKKTLSTFLSGIQFESDAQNIPIHADFATVHLVNENRTHPFMPNNLLLQDCTDLLEIDSSAIWQDERVNISDNKTVTDEQYSAAVIQTMDPGPCDILASQTQSYSGPSETFPCVDETCSWTVLGKIRQPDINFSFMSSPRTAGDPGSVSDVEQLNRAIDDLHCAGAIKQMNVSDDLANSVECVNSDQKPNAGFVCCTAAFDASLPPRALSYAKVVMQYTVQMQYATETTSPIYSPVYISVNEKSNNTCSANVSRISNLKKLDHICAFDSVRINAIEIQNDAFTFTTGNAHIVEKSDESFKQSYKYISDTGDKDSLFLLKLNADPTDRRCSDVGEFQNTDDPEGVVSSTTLSVQSMEDRDEQVPSAVDSLETIITSDVHHWPLTDESYDIAENELWLSLYDSRTDSPEFDRSFTDNESYRTAYDDFVTEDESFSWAEDSYTAAVISSMEDSVEHKPIIVGISNAVVAIDKPCAATPDGIGDEPSSVSYPDEPIHQNELLGTCDRKEKESCSPREGHDERLDEISDQNLRIARADADDVEYKAIPVTEEHTSRNIVQEDVTSSVEPEFSTIEWDEDTF